MKTEHMKKAYQSAIETIEEVIDKEKKTLDQALDTAVEKLSEWKDLSSEEVEDVTFKVKRDLEALNIAMVRSKQEYRERLQSGAAHISDSIWEKLNKISDSVRSLHQDTLQDQVAEAISNRHTGEHRDHQEWDNVHAFWLDEIGFWKKDHHKALASLQEIIESIHRSETALERHAEAIRAHAEKEREHEHTLARVEHDPTRHPLADVDEDTPELHAQERSSHQEQVQLHEQLKRHHLSMMSLLDKLHQVASQTGAQAGGK